MVIPVNLLKKLGFKRKKCKICGRYFWTLDDKREVCADHENYSFIKNPIGKKLNYFEVWKDFSKFLEKRGYKPIKRYPVVARWRDDLDFVIASITVFQPWVTKGYIQPPAKKITIPQFCLRFNDIENVGFTGRHYTGFVMIGQHAFVKPGEYNTEEYFKDLLDWFLHLDIPLEEFVFHEDKWEGGGNAGYSIEFFVRGLEVANQVYMTYEIKNGKWIEMKNLKVLDMGMGQERVAWLLNGTSTSYDIVFPNTINYLKNNIKADLDWDLVEKITPYMSQYDFEEKSLNDFIKELNEIIGKNISETIKTLGALYSIPDHARTLLIAISDGSLPSNMGGGYNLRIVLRRMYNFIEKYFEIDLKELFKNIIKDWYEKELKENLEEVLDIINYEIEKYKETKKKAYKILSKIEIDKLDSKKLFDLYQSHGITLEIIREFYPDFNPPKDFYKYLEEHRKKSKKIKTKKDVEIDVKGFPKTYKAFYEDWKKYYDFAKYLGNVNNYLVFDKTIFYPLKGGQIYDKGWVFNLESLKEASKDFIKSLDFPDYVKEILMNYATGNKNYIDFVEIEEVYEINNVIIHKTNKIPNWSKDTKVLMIIDKNRRYNASRNHTATHILTGVLRKIYGKHIWQAGAEKDEYKGRLDVTHHKLPSKEEIKRIEEEVNKIILEMRPIRKFYLRRDEAERKYGFTIYQGGFIPEINLRIVEIENLDVEACSGTHLDNTIEVGLFKIIKVERIADGLIRFEFTTGENALRYIKEEEEIIHSLESIFNTKKEYLEKISQKVLREREEYKKKYKELLRKIIVSNIEDKKIKLKLENISASDILPIIQKLDLEEVYIECEEGIINSYGEGKKIGKFYLKFKS